jgi:hypothetical protein
MTSLFSALLSHSFFNYFIFIIFFIFILYFLLLFVLSFFFSSIPPPSSLYCMQHSTVFEGQGRWKGSSTWGWESPANFKWRVDGYPEPFTPPSHLQYSAVARIAQGAAFYEPGADALAITEL